MALVHYTAKVQGERLLELPEEARQLHLAPGQEVQIQLDPAPEQPAQMQDPALTLFAQWEREDAARSPAQAAADERLWEEFERGINADRRAQGMRPLECPASSSSTPFP